MSGLNLAAFRFPLLGLVMLLSDTLNSLDDQNRPPHADGDEPHPVTFGRIFLLKLR